MKIVQLVYALSSGGAEKFVVNLSNALAQMGHQVEVCMILRDDNAAWVFNKQHLNQNVGFHSLQLGQGFSIKKERAVYNYLVEARPDVVHCHLNVIPYLFRYAVTHRSVKIFHTVHNVAEKAAGLSIQKSLNRFFYNQGYITPVTISKVCLQSFEKYYNMQSVTCIDNGCPPIAPSPQLNIVKDEVEQYKATADTKIFIHVARCNPQKNQRLLIDAFNRLNDEHTDFALLILGSGFDSPEGQELQRLACNKIHFLGAKSNVGDYLLCSDAFCLTSVFEGLPISLIEAMSCGVCPICTPAGGIPDVIADGTTGYLSRDISLEAFVDALHNYLSSPIPPQAIKQHYNAHFSMQLCANQYVNLFEQIKRP